MKYKFDFKNISKNLIKKIIPNIRYKVNSISKLEHKISEISKISGDNKKFIEARELAKKYENDPRTQLFLAQVMASNWDSNCIKQINIYAESRTKWLKQTGLEEINMEFIDTSVVAGSLGNYWNLEGLIHSNIYNLRPKKNIYLLCDSNFRPRNETLFNYFAPYLNVVKDEQTILSLKKLESLLRLPVGFCLPFRKKGCYLDWIPNLVHQERIKLKKYDRHKTLKLTDDDHEKGKKILKKMGLPDNAWYVTLHVREPGYRGETKYNTISKSRNANPNNYIKSIKAITEAGGWVFRMGNPQGNPTKLPLISNVIDYAHSSIRSDFMDIFLAATCKFCIGTSSGYFCIPRYFGVPVILTNTPRTGEYFPLTEKDFFLPRIFFDKKTNKYIKFNELMAPPISFGGPDANYFKRNIEWMENQPEDLEGVTKEMLERTLNNKNNTESEVQKKFKTISEKSVFEKTGMRLKSFALIGRNFIERYSDLI